MGLFGKKKVDVCAICGNESKTGFFKGLFKKEIDGQFVCDECFGDVDLPNKTMQKMTIEKFRKYMAFREENKKLKEQFQVTNKVDFGAFDTKFMFDLSHKFLCLDADLNKTIFEGKNLLSFVIKEDECIIFEGSAEGLIKNNSTVREAVMAMTPQFTMYRNELSRYRDRMRFMTEEERSEARIYEPRFDIPEPFKKFNVEICLEHPYWKKLKADMNGPVFSNTDPSVENYLRTYNKNFATMEELASLLMTLAFPGAKTKRANNAISSQGMNMNVGGTVGKGMSADPVEELKRYKDLMDNGIISKEDFEKKKAQLLGL